MFMKIGGNRFLITGGAGLMGSYGTAAGERGFEIILLTFVRGSMHNIENWWMEGSSS
jgi:hypothetical protein